MTPVLLSHPVKDRGCCDEPWRDVLGFNTATSTI